MCSLRLAGSDVHNTLPAVRSMTPYHATNAQVCLPNIADGEVACAAVGVCGYACVRVTRRTQSVVWSSEDEWLTGWLC